MGNTLEYHMITECLLNKVSFEQTRLCKASCIDIRQAFQSEGTATAKTTTLGCTRRVPGKAGCSVGRSSTSSQEEYDEMRAEWQRRVTSYRIPCSFSLI